MALSHLIQILSNLKNEDPDILILCQKLLKYQSKGNDVKVLEQLYPFLFRKLFQDDYVRANPRSEITDIKRKFIQTWLICLIDHQKSDEIEKITLKVLENVVMPTLQSKMSSPKSLVRAIQILNLLGCASTQYQGIG